MSRPLLVGLFVLYVLNVAQSFTVLKTPHSISGMIWQDWDHDGIHDDIETGFPFVKISLLYQSSTELRLLEDSPNALVQIKDYFALQDGSFHFNCLAAGNYALKIHLPENRPSRTSPSKHWGTTSNLDNYYTDEDGVSDVFQVEDGGSSYFTFGFYQYVWVNQYSMTGYEAVPPAPTVATGVLYSVLNLEQNQMYYRIIRSFWPEGQEEASAGFFVGWAGENGPQANPLNDHTHLKENVWFIPDKYVHDLTIGKVYTLMRSTGSYNQGQLRGQFYNFRNGMQVASVLTLQGDKVVSGEVMTVAGGTVSLELSVDQQVLDYSVHLENLGTAQVQKVGIYGPADAKSTGPLLVELVGDTGSLDVSAVANFVNYFYTDLTYVEVSTSEYPNGHLRAQVTKPRPVVLHSIFNLTVNISPIGQGHAVFTLDWRKAELYYYVYIEGLENDEYETYLIDNETFKYEKLDGEMAPAQGNAVKQGYFFNLSNDQIDRLLKGKFLIGVDSISLGSIYLEMTGTLTNWF